MVFHLQFFHLVLRPVVAARPSGDAARPWRGGALPPRSSRTQCSSRARFHGASPPWPRPTRSQEVVNGGGGIAPAAHGRTGWASGDRPSRTRSPPPPAGAGSAWTCTVLGHVQPGELDLPGLAGQHALAVLHHPVVQGAVILIFQGAQGVGDALQRVARWDGQSRTWGRCTTCSPVLVMLLVQDAVHGRVAHVDVGARPCRSWRGESWLPFGNSPALHAAQTGRRLSSTGRSR